MSNIEINKRRRNLIVSVMLISAFVAIFKSNIIEYSFTAYYERIKNR